MSKSLDFYLNSQNVVTVFDVDFRTGSILDRSIYQAPATVVGDVSWCKNKFGYGIKTRTGSYISYEDNAANRCTGSLGFTIIILADFEKGYASSTRAYVFKAHPINNNLISYYIYTGVSLSTCHLVLQNYGFNFNASSYDNSVNLMNFVAFGFYPNASGNSNCNLFMDGNIKGFQIKSNITATSNTQPLLIGNGLNGNMPSGGIINRITIINANIVGTPWINQVYNQLMSERFSTRSYSFGNKLSIPQDPAGSSILLKTDFTTKLNDKLFDLSGNNWSGTINPGFSAIGGILGNSLAADSATLSNVDFGNITNINNTSSLSIVHYGQCGGSGNEVIFNKGNASNNRNDIISTNTQTTWSLGDSYSAYIYDSYVNIPKFQSWVFDGTQINSNKVKVYIDNNNVPVNISNSFPSNIINTSDSLQLGKLSWSNIYPPYSKNDFFAIYNTALSENQVNSIYKQIARKNTFKIDMLKVPVTLTNLIGGCEVPFTPFKLQAEATWQVIEDNNGIFPYKVADTTSSQLPNLIRKRWLQSISGDGYSLYMNSAQAYGTWVGEITHTAGNEYFGIISNKISITDSNINAYALYLSGTTISFIQYNPSAVTNTLLSKTNAITVGNVYKVAVTRRYDGQFYVYIKSGEYGAVWTAITPTSGTNPCYNGDYITSSYFIEAIDVGSYGSKFGSLSFFQGALTLADLNSMGL